MLEKSSNPMTVKQLHARYREGNLTFDHPVQRRGGQWGADQKSLFIHSIIDDFLIPSSVVVKGLGVNGKGNSYSVIDGQQRLTTLMEFLEGGFVLTESVPLFKKVALPLDMFDPLTEEELYSEKGEEEFKRPTKFSSERLIEEDGEFVAFDGKGLSVFDLPEDIYDELKGKSLSVTMYDSVITEEEIEELVYRLNNGKAMSSIQRTKARLGGNLIDRVQGLVNHDFTKNIASFTVAQLKNEKDLELILTLLYLAEYDEFSDMDLPTTMSAAFVAKYGETLKNKEAETIDMMFEKTTSVLDYLYSSVNGLIEDKDIKNFFKKPVHILPVFMTALTAIEKGTTETDFGEFLELFVTQFFDKSDDSTKTIYVDTYTKNTGAGSTKRTLLSSRIDAMKDGFLYDMQDITS